MTKTTTSYQQAYSEIQIILEEIENGNISIDELSEKVKRASELIGICKSKLRSTEEDVQNILDEMKEKE